VKPRVAGGLIGVVFGVVLSWSAMSNPAVVRQALLFERAYMFLFFAAAVLTAVAGLQLLKRYQRRSVLTDAPIGWTAERPERRHVTGALIFGLGWGLTGACPGPIATQLGQGIAWGLPIVAGVVVGVYLFLRRSDVETEPA
jgi:uncharacterized membrane protein YedE/YeeE